MKRILPLIALAFLTMPASAQQQQFNPDAAAYAVTQSALSLAQYANLLKQQIAEDQKQIADLKKQLDEAKKPKKPAAQ